MTLRPAFVTCLAFIDKTGTNAFDHVKAFGKKISLFGFSFFIFFIFSFKILERNYTIGP